MGAELEGSPPCDQIKRKKKRKIVVVRSSSYLVYGVISLTDVMLPNEPRMTFLGQIRESEGLAIIFQFACVDQPHNI